MVTLLSLYRCAGSFKQFIGVHVQKAYCKFSTYLWAFSKGTGQPDAYMRSLARAFAQRCKYLKRVCETVLMLVCQCKQWKICKGCQMFVLHWKCRPRTMSHFVRYLYCFHVYISIGSNQPAHLCRFARAFSACTQCTYHMCTYMYPF